MDINKLIPLKVSLKLKIAIAFAIITFIFVLLTSIFVQISSLEDVERAFEEKVASIIVVAESQLKQPLKAGTYIIVEIVVNGILQDRTFKSAWAFDNDRTVISDGTSDNAYRGRAITDEGFALSSRLVDVSDFSVLSPRTGDSLYWAKLIKFEEEPVGYLVLKTDTKLAPGGVSIFSALLWALVFGLAAGGLGFLFSFLIAKPMSSLSKVVEQVSMGLVESRSRVETGDEIEELGNSLNEMLDRIGGLIETEADRDRMQANVMNLLDIVDRASKGDLTVRGQVTSDALGSVTDAYNMMLTSISDLIRQVSESGVQVSETTREILLISEEINAGATSQAKELEVTSELMEELARSMEHVSSSATEAAESSDVAAKTAEKGALAVNNTIQGMNRIRANVQTTSKKIKSLGEKSLEINAIVEVIDEIAAQTNMLALNAAIEAARAGEYGRGFAVVANEIRSLAERSTEATTEIADLVKSIQSETSDAVTAMEESTGQVELGVRLADDAGKSLSEIQNVINKAASLIQEISVSALEHVQSTEKMVQAIENARGVAQNTTTSIQHSIDMVQQLASSSNTLSQAISQFKV